MAIDFDRLKEALADRYAVEREIGQGGMAVVYLAEDLKHSRKVAIKVLRPELAATLGVERFLREIETAAGLNHPHVLGLIDSGEADGLPYYVMPFVEGESLRQRLDRETQLPIDETIDLAGQVALALDYAHDHDVVHRDIKPANILLSGGQAIVTDFGIARAISSAGGDRLTATGLAVGSPSYMSPEQAAGERLDGRSDIYSLGCVVYEMLIGDPPFAGRSQQAVIARHSAAPVPVMEVFHEIAGMERPAEDGKVMVEFEDHGLRATLEGLHEDDVHGVIRHIAYVRNAHERGGQIVITVLIDELLRQYFEYELARRDGTWTS